MSAPSASWGEDEWDEASDADRRQALAAVLRDRDRLVDEVRALRADLDATRIGLDVETRRADDWQRVADEMREDMARAALVARTPHPTEPSDLVLAAEMACAAMGQLDPDTTEGAPVWDDHGDPEHVPSEIRALFAARVALMDEIDRATGDAAPLPAVPDGEARPARVEPCDCGHGRREHVGYEDGDGECERDDCECGVYEARGWE